SLYSSCVSLTHSTRPPRFTLFPYTTLFSDIKPVRFGSPPEIPAPANAARAIGGVKFAKIPKQNTNICETNGSIPNGIKAGAAIDDGIIYVGIDGHPIPRRRDATSGENN